jgi:hypothetical protein
MASTRIEGAMLADEQIEELIDKGLIKKQGKGKGSTYLIEEKRQPDGRGGNFFVRMQEIKNESFSVSSLALSLSHKLFEPEIIISHTIKKGFFTSPLAGEPVLWLDQGSRE